MSVTPNPDDGEPTAVMPARAVADALPPDIARWLATSRRRRRKRRLALSAVAGIVFIAGLAAAWFFFPRNAKSLAVSDQPAREVASPQVMRSARLPAPPPAPRTPDKPSSPRQMLNEIFEGRDRGYSVTASVDRGAVRISSSRPGYVYVLAASANESDVAALFVAVLFPRVADTNNRIRPGQALKLPDLRWPTNAEFLAIVSDEPRDIDVLGPLAGKVICPSTARCSESYGAVVFSHDGSRDTVRSPATLTPAARPTSKASRRCSDILERASLGEPLTDEEQTFLRRDCR
jgi:hypothetical protein